MRSGASARILVLRQALAPGAGLDERDTVLQQTVVAAALSSLGHQVTTAEAGLNVTELSALLSLHEPDLVFNLMESWAGTDELLHVIPALLERWGVRYTGASARTLALTTDKVVCKHILRAAGLPTPDWGLENQAADFGNIAEDSIPGGDFIIKPISADASLGIDDHAVVRVPSPSALRNSVLEREELLKTRCFVERFVRGREVNVALLQDGEDTEIIGVSEISFDGFPADQPRIVGYAAKWQEDSFEFRNTPRHFWKRDTDSTLYDALCGAARRAWSVLSLRGYARVDFRVDEASAPWILEVNANPCLSPDAGFAAALENRGLTFETACARIVSACTALQPGWRMSSAAGAGSRRPIG